MKKYCVHMGVRFTKDFYVIAHDEDEAKDMAESLFGSTPFEELEFANTDSDIWEEDFEDDEADDIAEEE